MARPSTRRTNADAVAGPRGRLRRLLDVWGLVPGFAVAHDDVVSATRDGVRLAASYLPGAGAAQRPAGEVPAVLLLHGFAGHRRKPAYAYLSERLSAVAAVLAVDLRGHGALGGRSAMGLAEAQDVTASAAWLRRGGHRWVGVVGASMGAAAAMLAAGRAPPGAYDALCAISAPAVWGRSSARQAIVADSRSLRQLNRAATVAWYRRVLGATLRVRIAARAWPDPALDGERQDWPLSPLDAAPRLAPTPLLVVHGVDDHYFGAEQAELLHRAARPPKALWLEPAGFGHAEDGFTSAFADRLVAAVRHVRAHGVWPQRSQSLESLAPSSPAVT